MDKITHQAFPQMLTSRRFLAGLIDYAIIWGSFYVIAITLGTANNAGEYHLHGFPVLLPIAVLLLLTVIIEQLMGATIGNGILNLKPLSAVSQQKPTFKQSLLRHLADPIDMFPFGLIAIITIKNTVLRQRLGDIWAKTIVVRDNY